MFVQWEPDFSYTWKVSNRWTANTKMSIRNTLAEPSEKGTTAHYQVNYIQPQLFATYSLWTNLKLSAGYTYQLSQLTETHRGQEHRPAEQVAFLTYLGATRIAHRIRLEQRFRQRDYTNRIRYRFAYDTPLNGQQLDPGEKYLVASNEFLFSFDAARRLGENRAYLGIGWYFNDQRKLEAGLQYRLAGIGTHALINTLWLTTAFYWNR